MPAQIFITKAQIAEMHELGEDVMVLEGPVSNHPEGNTLDIWVFDHETLTSSNHRSVVIDPHGNVLGDSTLPDE